MIIVNSKSDNFLIGQGADGLFGVEKESNISPNLEMLAGCDGVDSELFQRARDREDEERDLRVLDGYNRFEAGLQEILVNPESGLMELRAGDAQLAVFKVNDYFAEEGGRLRDSLPDDECRTRFMDILESRRKTAVEAVARHQSQEYQNWKERTAADTIDSVLKAVNLSPDAASLMHGEGLLEGAILRLYRGSNPELLQLRLITAKQAMYAGALETIGMKDPVTALIMCESWKEQLGEAYHEQLHDLFEPLARNQTMKQEFYFLRNMDEEQLEAELEDLKDEDMRRELSEMLAADAELRERLQQQTVEERVNMACRELFKKFVDGDLTVESILDSGLDGEMRSLWLLIFSRKGEKGSDEVLIKVVQGLINDEISAEFQIHGAIVDGLGEMDASMLASLFMLKENPESRLMVNGLSEICEPSVSGDQRDQAAAIRDFLNRVTVLVSKGESFSVTKIRNEVVADHFEKGMSTKAEPEPEVQIQDFESGSEEKDDPAANNPAEIEPEVEDESGPLSKKDDAGYHDPEI